MNKSIKSMIIILGVVLANFQARAEDLALPQKTASRVLSAPLAANNDLPPSNARLDENGRIILNKTGDEDAPVQVVGEGEKASNPCPNATELSPDEAKKLVQRIAEEERFFPDFVLAVAKVESKYISTSYSDKGAYGLMQIMPALASDLKIDVCDPAQNVRGGIRQLRYLHQKYRNPMFILSAYNAGEQAMLNAKGIPSSRETVSYIAAVLNEFYDWPVPDSPALKQTDVVIKSDDLTTKSNMQHNDPRLNKRRDEQYTKGQTSNSNWLSGFVQNFD